MASVTAQEYAEKWGRRLKGSSEDIRRGIARVSVAPGELAARQQQLMLDKLTQSILDGTWAAQVRGVSLEDWKTSATAKGLARIASGVDGAQGAQVQMAERLLQAVDAAVSEANRTPRGDLEANISRMTTFVRSMAGKKLRRPGGR
jgi:hypothetical protein